VEVIGSVDENLCGTKDTEAILQKMISETEKRKCVMLL